MNASHDLPAEHGLTIPPQAIEAEQSVLGALLLDNDAVDRIVELRAEHFYRYDHRIIFEHITRMIMAGRRADVITTYEALGTSGKDQQVGGLSYLNDLAQNVPGSAGIRRYAEIVIERAQLRGILCAVDEIGAMVHNRAGKTASEIIAVAQERLEPLAEARSFEPKEVGPILTSIVEEIDARYHGAELPVVPTGFRDLDAKLGGGMRGSELIIVAGRPSMGKAQPLDAKILSGSGEWACMGDLSIGDRLASVNGSVSVVTGIFPQGVKPVYRVKFSDGRATEACGEHLWAVHSSKWVGAKVLTTDQVSERMKKVRYRGRMWVESVSGNFGATENLPIDPWLMGALLGDGNFTGGTPRFSKGAAEVVERVKSSLPEGVALVQAGGVNYRISQHRRERKAFGNEISTAIEGLGLKGCDSLTKFVPQCYLEADRDARLALLRGLLDTDGWVEKTGSVQFSTSSKRMSRDIVYLARSLGYWVTAREKHPTYTYKGGKHAGATAYVSTISGARTSELFLFSEKAVRCIDADDRGRIRFEAVEYSRETECQCISVSHPSRLYVTDDFILTHNTAFSMSIAGNIAQNGGVVLVFSLEMSGKSLHQRNIARVGGIRLDHVLDGKKITDDDWPRLTHAISVMSEMQMLIDDTDGLSLAEIVSRSRSTKRRAGRLDLVMVDYLGLMTGGTSENQNLRIASYSAGLKGLAKQLDVPVIALSQLNRGVEQRPNKRPNMGDLRDSGAIEQDADVILMLYRDEVYNPDSTDRGMAEIIVGKQRNGETGPVRLAFMGEYQRFADLAPGYVPMPHKAPEKVRRGFE